MSGWQPEHWWGQFRRTMSYIVGDRSLTMEEIAKAESYWTAGDDPVVAAVAIGDRLDMKGAAAPNVAGKSLLGQ